MHSHFVGFVMSRLIFFNLNIAGTSPSLCLGISKNGFFLINLDLPIFSPVLLEVSKKSEDKSEKDTAS